MADGDLSLDAGYLGHKIGACYEALGQLQEAKYWYGRAVEENPDVDEYRQSRGRIKDMSVERYVKGE